MLKSILEFFTTGLALLVSYIIYFLLAFSVTFMFGLPIGLGVYVLIEFMKLYLFPMFGNN
jgi:hypothetical protein